MATGHPLLIPLFPSLQMVQILFSSFLFMWMMVSASPTPFLCTMGSSPSCARILKLLIWAQCLCTWVFALLMTITTENFTSSKRLSLQTYLTLGICSTLPCSTYSRWSPPGFHKISHITTEFSGVHLEFTGVHLDSNWTPH